MDTQTLILPDYGSKTRKTGGAKVFWFQGDIAQLARACDWQSQGQGFDSPYLHKVANFQLVI